MKKIYIILQVLIAAVYGNVCAQSVLCDTTRVFDTVTDQDSFYFFSSPKPCFIPTQCDIYPECVMLQEYVTHDSLTVYGVAITVRDWHNTPICDNSNFFQAMLMTCLGPSQLQTELSTAGHYSMLPIDTVNLSRAHTRFCWFNYDNGGCNIDSIENNPCKNHPDNCLEIRPCYELYFDTPQQINVMTDTFYVGIEWFVSSNFSPMYFGGRYSSSSPSHLMFVPGMYNYGGYDYAYRINYSGSYYTRMWGIAFPIIGFRCGPMKNYWLEEYMGHYAIVRWRNTEPGTMYNVRLVGEDGSDTTIVTQDTVYVFNWLSDSVRYNVMLRKQCRYCTSNYDTTVYGGWGDTIFFGTTILDTVWRTVTASSNNPAMGLVAGGGVYPDSSTVTLTANPFDGHQFDAWNDGDSTNPRQIFVVSDTTFSAIFHEVEDTVAGGDTLAGEDTVGILQPADEGFVLRPNPTRGLVQIVLPPTAAGGHLSLCDMTGREIEVRTVTGTTMELDVRRLPAGTYLIKLETPQGTYSKKLVIRD